MSLEARRGLPSVRPNGPADFSTGETDWNEALKLFDQSEFPEDEELPTALPSTAMKAGVPPNASES